MERILWANRVHQICNVMWLKLESTLFQIASSDPLGNKWFLSFQLQASLSLPFTSLPHSISLLSSPYLEHPLEKFLKCEPS